MADIRSTPRNPYLGAAADVLRPLADLAGKYEVRDYVPLLGGSSLDELLGLRGSQSLLEDMSYGAPLVRTPAYGSQLVNMQADPRALDLIDLMSTMYPPAKAAIKGGRMLAKAGAKELARQIEHGTGPVGRLAIDPRSYVVKPEGGQWLDDGVQQLLNRYRMVGDDAAVAPVNRWLDTALRKYLVRDFASPSDPLRRLAEQDITIMNPKELERMALSPRQADAARRFSNLIHKDTPAKPMAKRQTEWIEEGTPTPDVDWENTADVAIDVTNAADAASYRPEQWLGKLDPDTPVYSINPVTADRLGFEDMVDALVADINEGLLRPDQLNKLSVEEMAKRTHNRRVAKEQAERIAIGEGLPVHKAYGDFSWRDLNTGDPALTSKALRAEGELMNNCVGSYCEGPALSEILGGDRRILTLRDAEHRPHVTVEVLPMDLENDSYNPVIRQIYGHSNSAPKSEYQSYIQDLIRSMPDAKIDLRGPNNPNLFEHTGMVNTDLLKQGLVSFETVPGSMQRSMSREVNRLFPMVTDPATGAHIAAGEHGTRIPFDELLPKALQGFEGGRYATPKDIEDYLQALEPFPIEAGYAKPYADGGLVELIREERQRRTQD